MDKYTLKTEIGTFLGNERENCIEFLGIKYANAKRFEYSTLINNYGDYDATKRGPSCMQKRGWPEFEHLEIPARAFYNREFRDGTNFEYSEDGLYLNIFTPKEGNNNPVIVYFYGGGFDSGSINESTFDGEELSKRGNTVVFASYRVGVFGYFTNEEIYNKEGRDGNFGLDDMFKALLWVNENIHHFGGDNKNITLMGQSAGAMSIQYLLCSEKAKNLFQKGIMMSGAGLFPKFSLPRPCEKTREYWKEVMALCNTSSLEEIKNISPYDLLKGVEKQKSLRKDNTYNTMPVIDHYLITDSIDKLIKHPQEKPLIIGFTNNDMFTLILANMSKKYAKKHNSYLYYFDIDAKGDNNQAFHSSDIRYVFGTLSSSWRPYEEEDYKTSNMMMDYITSFTKNGNPNHDGAPKWDTYKGKALHITTSGISMDRIKSCKLIKNTFKGDPQ